MRSRKAGLPLATRARKRELCPKRYVSRMTRTEYFLSQNSFIFFGNHFSPRFMLPCLLLVIFSRKYIYRFSKYAPTPRYTILDSRLPPCNAILEGRPLLSNTSSEAGALPLEVRIENDWDQIFFKSKFAHSFLETTFLHVSCYPVIVNRKYINGFSKSAPTPRYTILDSRLPPCNAISEGRPPLSNTSSEARALPLEVRIENDWDQIFFKSKFVHSFLETTFLHVLCYAVIVSRKYIYRFSKSAPTPRYTILDSRLPACNAISEGRPPVSNTSSEAGALP